MDMWPVRSGRRRETAFVTTCECLTQRVGRLRRLVFPSITTLRLGPRGVLARLIRGERHRADSADCDGRTYRRD